MTHQRPMRLRRVELAVPASNEKVMAKAAASEADLVFLDNEDSVAPSAKVESREKIVQALKNLDWSGKTTCVRINELGSEWAHEDIIHVVDNAHEQLDLIMVPKVRTPSDVLFVDTLLTGIEKKLKLTKTIGLEVLIEEVEAMINVEAIARCTPRLEALIFGMGDYSASQGVDRKAIAAGEYPGDHWHYQRSKMVIACRAAGIEAVDGPQGNFRDTETYAREAARARILGCVGKWAIHPVQIPIALEAFTPLQEDVDLARRIVGTFKKAEAEGQGTIVIDGVMFDAASVRSRQNIVDRADLIGM
ncbi:HpcH/HpaI aldolase/citrate lyase family protein [Chelativorans alearense]|uniref:HpcH/HpaI aldolase/citrate lyase family protein n=1 Tax=Chelativorans alearense TaxID=2681495 RepID=UPI0013D7EB22|nr:CoA ester lyase [Chelativorans alearense]